MSDLLAQTIAEAMNLRPPLATALRRLHANLSAVSLHDGLAKIKDDLPSQFSFDTEFPSFCFDVATGVGKTRLMGACIAYLYEQGLSRNFFLLAPGETIYRKMKAEIVRSHPKYLFAGLPQLHNARIVTGDDYQWRESLSGRLFDEATIYIFNIQKLLKGGEKQKYKFHSFLETLGRSFADAMREKGDLVLLMDESHRYRGPKFFEALHGLEPLLGLEFTATPAYHGNKLVDYSMRTAIEDGWVKRVRPIYRENDAQGDEHLDLLKLQDGLRIHLRTKAHLETCAANEGLPPIRPLVFINTRDIEHGQKIQQLIESKKIMGGQFKGKTLLIHSKSNEEDEEALVALETPDSNVEVVIHVMRLKEGWDVQNIYTIIPLRVTISETLGAQTIGRGVRLPFGKSNRSEFDDEEVAKLNVICYQKGKDNYKAIIEAAEYVGEVRPETADEEPEVESHELKFAGPRSSHAITVPVIEQKVTASSALEPFSAKPQVELGAAETKLVGVDLPTGAKETVDDASMVELEDEVHDLLKWLLNHDHLDISDAPVLQAVVEPYLQAATASQSKKKWQALLRQHRQTVRDDLAAQIEKHVRVTESAALVATGSKVQFAPSRRTVGTEGGVKQRTEITSKDDVRELVVGGYTKTVFAECAFDSAQEKTLADVLTSDSTVLRWLRVPEGQFTIPWSFGDYSPDFIAETEETFHILEVKDAGKVRKRDQEVVEKARAAVGWCEVATKHSRKPWEYHLLPHDRVSSSDDLAGALAKSVALGRFLRL
ncbi:MAG: DEAD/DEAH box helicase family protein [Armatimonadetes bacterium]|nr:DEAD/DEAH box helicase family protein [Armatimonadota bacterium]